MTTQGGGISDQPGGANGQSQGGTQDGRDGQGRFRKGNRGGPGNPFARQMARMRRVMLDAVSEEDLQDIMGALVESAREGDLGAAKVVLSYVVGKPGPAVDPDRVDVDEFQLFQEEARSAQEVHRPMEGVPVGLALEVLRAMLPALQDGYKRQMREAFFPESVEQVEEEAEDKEGEPPAEQEPAPEAKEGAGELEQRAPEALPTVEQILAFEELLRVVERGKGQSASGTDGNGSEAVGRAANRGRERRADSRTAGPQTVVPELQHPSSPAPAGGGAGATQEVGPAARGTAPSALAATKAIPPRGGPEHDP